MTGVDPVGRCADRPTPTGRTTADRILDAALASFGSRGYEATSLDALADGLGMRKQSILYWFPSKEVLLEAVIDRSGGRAGRRAGGRPGRRRVAAGPGSRPSCARSSGWPPAGPELLGLVREVGRLGPPAATRLIAALEPLVARASEFLEAEMDAGHMRRHEPRLLLLAIYSTVIGMVTEVEVLRALGEEPTARSLVRRRQEILSCCARRFSPRPTSRHR